MTLLTAWLVPFLSLGMVSSLVMHPRAVPADPVAGTNSSLVQPAAPRHGRRHAEGLLKWLPPGRGFLAGDRLLMEGPFPAVAASELLARLRTPAINRTVPGDGRAPRAAAPGAAGSKALSAPAAGRMAPGGGGTSRQPSVSVPDGNHKSGTFGYDNHRTGQTPHGSLANPSVKCHFETPHNNENFYASPAIASDGTIIAVSFINNSPFFVLPFDKTQSEKYPYCWWGDGFVYALNPDCSLKWSYNIGGWMEASPALGSDGTVYIGNLDGDFVALDMNGDVKWKHVSPSRNWYCESLLPGPLGALFWTLLCDNLALFSSPLILDDKVIFGSRDAHVYMLSTDDGTVIRRIPVTAEVHSAPALSRDGSRFYLATTSETSDNIFAFDADTGDIVWQTKSPCVAAFCKIYSLKPVVDEQDRVSWASFDGNVYAFDGATGALLWTYANQMSKAGMALSTSGPNSVLYTAGFDGILHAIDPAAGTQLWTVTLCGICDGVGSISADGLLHAATYSGYLYGIEPNGTVRWKVCPSGLCDVPGLGPFDLAIQNAPTIDDAGRVVVGTYDGNVYILDD